MQKISELMIRSWLSILVLLFGSLLGPQSNATDEIPALLKEVAAKYKKAAQVNMAVEKVVKAELMGRESTYTGMIQFAEGLFRWKNIKPDETLLIYDGSTVWNVQYPTQEFPGPVQVMKSKVDKKTRAQMLVGNLFGKQPLAKQLKILNNSVIGKETVFEAQPLAQDVTITGIKLYVDSEKKLLSKLSYLDDVGNLTTLKFSDVQFHSKKDKGLFKFTPPKGAQVTNI